MNLRERTITAQPDQGRRKKPQRKLPSRKTKPNNLVCPRTNQRIAVVTQLSPDEVVAAQRTKQSPFRSQNDRTVVLVHHPKIRHQVYERHARAWEDWEVSRLPMYGGRPWKVEVTLSDPTSSNRKYSLSPYFCFNKKGQLELATWPNIRERVPAPPKWPGFSGGANAVPDVDAAWRDLYDLQERPVTLLSRLAYDHKHQQPLPTVTIRWTSPLYQRFTSREKAYEHAMQLARNEVIIDKAMTGYDERGRPCKVLPCSKSLALRAGKLRFERDGLWVVGQEDEWRYRRALELGIKPKSVTEEKTFAAATELVRKKQSPLSYFLQCRRHEYRQQRQHELQKEVHEQLEMERAWMRKEAVERQLSKVVKDSKPVETEHETSVSSLPSASTPTDMTKSSTYLPGSCPVPLQPTAVSTADSSSPVVPSAALVNMNHPFWAMVAHNQLSIKPMKSPVSTEIATSQTPSVSSVAFATPDASCAPPMLPTVLTPPKKVSFTLQKAESELRLVWKTMSMDERAVWEKRLASEEAAKLEANTEMTWKVTEMKCPIASASVIVDVETKKSTGSSTTPSAPETDKNIVSPSPVNEATEPKNDQHIEEPSGEDERTVDLDYLRANLFRTPVPSSEWCLTEEQVRMCYEAGLEHYDQVMRTVAARNLVRELQDGFDVLRERGRGRFDMELPAFDEPRFSFFSDLKQAPWMPIVHQILGKDVVLIHRGMFLSMPGAEKQEYHQDGVHLTTQFQKPCHAINVFVPLVDLTINNGPTHFCRGTHILQQDEYDSDFAETPLAKAGTPVIFDYRTGHYGMANTGDSCRPILYCTYAAAAGGKEFRDSVNFSRRRYHRIGDLVTRRVDSRDDRANKRQRTVNVSLFQK